MGELVVLPRIGPRPLGRRLIESAMSAREGSGMDRAEFAHAINRLLGYGDMRADAIAAYEHAVCPPPADIWAAMITLSPRKWELLADVFGEQED